MNKPNVIKLIDFINSYGGKNHSKDNENEKLIGQQAEKEERNLQIYLGEKFNFDISKSPQQWQNSGHITTYFWIQLKDLNYINLPISISIFTEKYLNDTARYRVTIEYDYKYAEDKEIDCFENYKSLINYGKSIDDQLNYFVCTDRRNETNYLISEKNTDILNQLYLSSNNEIEFYDSSLIGKKKKQIGRVSRIQLSKIIKETKDNDILLNEIENSISLLQPYYIKLLNNFNQSTTKSNEKLNMTSSPFDCKNFCSSNTYASRYIGSLLAKPFVILSGNSGTGKTRIATRFAKYLEKKNDSGLTNYLLIPVGADWTDNTKILGYYNPLADNGAGKYEKTDVFRFIERAGANPEIPFFLILDEMNLSHVERYFSDFLSKMELLDYKENSEPVFFDIPGYGKLELPKNLFITGTVNIDETTYMFSPKVLDRANVIEFKPEMSEVLESLTKDASNGEQKSADDGVAEGFMQLANEVRSGTIPSEVQQILEGIKPILESFYKELEKCGFEFAYRTVKEIRLYAIAAYKTAEGEKTTAAEIADIQILQKILPKIHGNKKQIGNLLDELEKLCEANQLKESLAKIRQMKDKLNRFQYASFI